MIRIGKHPEDMPAEEVKAVFAHANEQYPNAAGTVDIELDGAYVDLTYNISERVDVPFQRIRRITGYLVGGLGRWNDAKLHELSDREKHLEVRTWIKTETVRPRRSSSATSTANITNAPAVT